MAKGKEPRKTRKKARDKPRAPNPGLPDKETIISERTFVSPKGTRFRIIKTTQKDPYDPPDNESNGDS